MTDSVEPTSEPVSGTADADEVATLRAENERLRAEQTAMQAQLAGASAPPEKGRSPVRTFFAWLLAILAIVALVTSVAAVWAQTTVSDRDRFVSTLEPLPQNEAVAAALSVGVADGVVEVADIEAAISENLPEGLAFASGPLTQAVHELTKRTAEAVVRADAFSAVWNTATGAAHTAANAILTGNDAALEAEGGVVAIDLDTIAEPVVEKLNEAGLDLSSLVGEDFTLGRIELYEDEDLAAAQAGAQGLQTAGWLIPLIALVLIVAAIVIAPDRRHMVAILGFGTAIGMLVMLISLRVARLATVGSIDDELNQEASEASWDILLRYWTAALWALAFIGLVVGIAAWLVGPSPRAGRSRDAISDRLAGWSSPNVVEPTGFSGFFYRYRRPIEWTIIALGIIVLLIVPLTLWVAIITVIVVVILLAVVEVIAGPKVPKTDEQVAATATSPDEGSDG